MKHTRYFFCVIFIFLILTVTSGVCIANSPIKPARSECIIGYDLDWSRIESPNKVRNAIGEFMRNQRPRLWGGAIFSEDGSKFYVQYAEHCDEKEKMAQEIFYGVEKQGLALPKLARIPDPIEPSLNTIEVRGSAWSDSSAPPEHIITGRYPPVETAEGLSQDCNKNDDDNNKSFCVGYIEGVFEVATNNPVDRVASCVNRLRNSSSVVRLTLKWIASHPEKAQEPASTAIAEALAEAYPCKDHAR